MTRTQTFNQEEYQATLEELAKVGKGTKLYKNWKNDKDGDQAAEILANLGQTLTDDQLAFNNATVDGIRMTVEHDLATRKQGLEDRFNQYKPNILDDYITTMDRTLPRLYAAKKAETEQQLSEALGSNDPNVVKQAKEIVKQLTERKLYQEIGRLMRSIPVSEEYKEHNPEVYKNVKDIEEKEKLRRQGNLEALARKEVAQRKLHPAYGMLPVAKKWASEGNESAYEAGIGKAVLTKTQNGYKINKEELAKYVGNNIDAYAAMAVLVEGANGQQ
ncbi:MAG TPA: hypothetical protein VJJ23_01515 [Candidatus Nanoarchaeia archaeon]|nr:hypothetical protein [Candidatus Nanoarchaeia archaeon]